jgi:creatinine amidohydrolase
MGIYSEHLIHEVRLERMRPAQVEQAKQERPAIYVPFGSIEWHGIQNPVGLDAIKAHEQLVGLATRTGGVVYPPGFFGSGGGHLDWPHTFMVNPEPMIQIVTQLLAGFERVGYQKTILISGHYPNRSDYLDLACRAYQQAGGKMDVLALVENQVPNGLGDHAALYETSFMLYLHPDTVDMDLLVDLPGEPNHGQQIVNWMVDEYKGHPLYGLVGIDPRHNATARLGQEMTDNLLNYLQAWLDGNNGY